MEESPGTSPRAADQGHIVYDLWYIDDGQVFCRPGAVPSVLGLLDEELAKVGAERGSREKEADVKTTVRRFDPP